MAEYPVRLICRATGWPRSSVYHEASQAADDTTSRRSLGREYKTPRNEVDESPSKASPAKRRSLPS
jgi:hypothetical protein